MDISAVTKDKFQAWVPFDDDVEVLINYVPRERLAAIGKQSVVTRLDEKTREEQKDYDAIGADVLIACEAVAAWRRREGREGVETGFANGEHPFPCTPENVELLVRKWAVFAKFVSTACADVRRLAELQKEQSAKN